MNEEKKINDDFEMIDFEEATDDNIETLGNTISTSFLNGALILGETKITGLLL